MTASEGDARPRFVSRPREELDPEQQALYDLIVSGPRASQSGSSPFLGPAGELIGPFGPMTIAPAIGEAVQSVGAALRYRSGLSPLVRETSILLVAVARDSGFEWLAHVGLAVQAGLELDQLDEIRAGGLPSGIEGPDGVALRTVAELLAESRLGDEAYARATEALGDRAVAELVWLVGYYSMLALALAVYAPQDTLGQAAGTPRTEGA